MIEDEGKKEDKLEFTPEGETLGYISLDQARVLALRHARDNREVYGRYANTELVWEELSAEESEDYYRVRLSFRPARRFRGRAGIEQFTIDKAGPIELRQVVRDPIASNSRNFTILALMVVIAIGATMVGLFGSGAFTSSSGSDAVEATPSVMVPLIPEIAARLTSLDGDVGWRRNYRSRCRRS